MEINHKPHETGIQRRLLPEATTEGLRAGRTGGDESPAVPTASDSAGKDARVQDRVELSDRARLLARTKSGASDRIDDDEARQARLAELRAAYESGELNTPGRIEQAARRMLGDS
jgi:hypothetical protein